MLKKLLSVFLMCAILLGGFAGVANASTVVEEEAWCRWLGFDTTEPLGSLQYRYNNGSWSIPSCGSSASAGTLDNWINSQINGNPQLVLTVEGQCGVGGLQRFNFYYDFYNGGSFQMYSPAPKK